MQPLPQKPLHTPTPLNDIILPFLFRPYTPNLFDKRKFLTQVMCTEEVGSSIYSIIHYYKRIFHFPCHIVHLHFDMVIKTTRFFFILLFFFFFVHIIMCIG